MDVTEAASIVGNDALEIEMLRCSVQSRCQQAGMAFVAMALNTIFCVLLLGRGVSAELLAAWLIGSTGLLLIRYLIARQATQYVPASMHVVSKFDRQFRAVSIASQTTTGAGIWIVVGASDEIAAYVVTLLICLYAVGAMVNLAHDFRSFRLTIPLLMGQPTLYWLGLGSDGLAIVVILVGLTILMIISVRNSQRNFDAGIKIRFEKDELLKQLVVERQVAIDAQEQAEIANRSKSFFMAAASHDLRQPLYAVTILRDTLALHQLPDSATKLLEQQGHALGIVSGLFDSLLDLSKFESGTVTPIVKSQRLNELFKEIEVEFSPLCAAKGLCFTAETTSTTVLSDYDLLERLLRNLVSNAVRYTATGFVRIRCAIDLSDACLIVEDSGIGIATEDQERIFKEFLQLNNPHRSRDKGIGLGLAIVRHISVLLNHPISVESTLGVGTRMSIRIPIAVINPPTDHEAPLLVRNHVDITGLRAWVIENDPIVQEALTQYLEKRGCATHTFSSSEDLKKAHKQITAPDFAILDDMLGDNETGLELATQLAQQIDKTRILVMTGNPDPSRWQALTQSGFAVLRKPIFESVLNNWLSDRVAEVDTTTPKERGVFIANS